MLLILVAVSVLCICLAISLDSYRRVPIAAAATYTSNDLFAGNSDLVISGEDSLDDEFTQLMRRGDKLSSDLQLCRNEDYSKQIREFLESLRKLYDRYEIAENENKEKNQQQQQNDDNSVVKYTNELMQSDQPPSEEESVPVEQVEKDIDKSEETIDREVPSPLKEELKNLLERGRRLLEYYSRLRSTAKERDRAIATLKQEIEKLKMGKEIEKQKNRTKNN